MRQTRRDRILFVDLELTCWEGGPPQGMHPEIIEIGIAELDPRLLQITRSESILVRPKHSTVSSYCESLTGLEDELVRRNGRPLHEALAYLSKHYGIRNKPWMAWGRDQRALLEECARKGIKNAFSMDFHDIGMQFSLLMGSKGGIGLDEALELAGLRRQGRAHSGVDDAVNTAWLWASLAERLRQSLKCRDNDFCADDHSPLESYTSPQEQYP